MERMLDIFSYLKKRNDIFTIFLGYFILTIASLAILILLYFLLQGTLIVLLSLLSSIIVFVGIIIMFLVIEFTSNHFLNKSFSSIVDEYFNG